MRKVVLVAHNLRSCHNVGSLLRTADGLGVTKVYLTGYSPYPNTENDSRLPHLARRIHQQIHKTALGAETSVDWEAQEDVGKVFEQLRLQDYQITALEQQDQATQINNWELPARVALVVGRETKGLEADVLKQCDLIVEIPMFGKKESFNVTQAAAMGLFHLRFTK